MSSESSSKISDHAMVIDENEDPSNESSALGAHSSGLHPNWQSIRGALDEASRYVPHLENVRTGVDLHELIEQLKKENAEKSSSEKEKELEIARLNGRLKLFSEELSSVEDQNDKLKTENDQLSTQVVALEADKRRLVDISHQQGTDLGKLEGKLNDAYSEIFLLKSNKSTVDSKFEELENSEITLTHREKRLENERESLNKRIEKLVSELDEVDSRWLVVNKDNLDKISSLQSYVGELRLILNEKDSEISLLKADNSRLVIKNDELLSNLKVAREESASSEQAFEESLASHLRIIQLHTDKAAEATQKEEELVSAVGKLQGLLKESVERNEAQEKLFQEERSHLEAEINVRDEDIKKLAKELENANVLVAALEEQNETRAILETQGSSSKSQSSRIERPKDLSFTNVFSALCEREDEVEKLRKENSSLKYDLNQVFSDLENTAPTLQRQQKDYEHVKVCLESANHMLESERDQLKGWRNECELYRTEVEALNEENSRLKKQVSDLGLQVSILVREVETARFGGRPLPLPDVTLESDSTVDHNDVITHRLLPFRNIRELQEKNIQLVTVTRELSENQERLISMAVNERTQSLNAELQEAKEKLNELSKARQSHESLIEKLLEKHSARQVAESRGSDSSKTHQYFRSDTSNISNKDVSTFQNDEAEQSHLETEVQKLKEDLAKEKEYLTETKDELERVRKELVDAKSSNLKNQSLEEYHNERLRLLEVDVQAKQREIKNILLEDANLKKSNLKLQQSNLQLDGMVKELKGRAAKNESKIKKLLESQSDLRGKVEKLSASLHEAQTSSVPAAIVEENLKQFKLQLQMSEEKQFKGLKAQNDNLAMEVKILQDRLKHTEGNYETDASKWEKLERKLRNELDAVQAKEKDLMNSLKEANKELERRGQQSSSSLQDGSGDHHSTIDDLETQIRNLKEEKFCLQQALSANKTTLECFKELASRAEAKLIENVEKGREAQQEYEMEIKTMNDRNLEMEERTKELESERVQLLKKVHEIESRPDPSEIYRVELTEAHAEIIRKETELKMSTSAFTKLEKEYKDLADKNELLQHDFEKECKLHQETTDHLSEMRHQEAVMRDKVSELLKQNISFSERLDISTRSLASSEESHRKEYDLAREHIAALNSENSLLMERLNGLAQQVQSLSEKEPNLNTSLSGEESLEQLMDIIKFLRREKDLLLQKLEIADTEVLKFKSQVRRLEGELQEIRVAYEFACKKSSSEEVMSAKYTQLLESIGTISEIKELNSNLLREKETLQSEISSFKQQLEEALKRAEPIQSESQSAEAQISNQKIEIETLKKENLMWRQRANQLIEKNHKINPEELKRLENENATLKTTNGQLSVQNRQLTANLGSLNSRLRATNDDFSNMKKTKDAEITQLSLEVAQAKSNLQQSVTKLSLAQKKVTELEQNLKDSKAEALNLKAENEAHLTEIQSGEKAKAEIETLKKEIAMKNQQLEVKENGLGRIRNIAKSFKEKAETVTSEKTALVNEKNSLEAEKAILTSEKLELEKSKATLEEDLRQARETLDSLQKSLQESEEQDKNDEASALLQQSSVLIETLEKKNVEIEKELERAKKELKDAKEEADKKEEKYRASMTIAKENITSLQQENLLLKAARGGDLESPTKIRGLSKENSELKAQLEEQKDKVKKAEEESEGYKIKYQQALEQASASQSEKVEKPQQETVTASVKPVISTTAQPNQRKSATLQPQAHIQPTRHSPAQTATMVVRPTAMRSAPPLNRSSIIGDQPQVNVVGPIVSTPMIQISESRDSVIDDLPRALVQPRQTPEEPPTPGTSRISESSTSSTVPEQSPLPSLPGTSDPGPQKRSRELSSEPADEAEPDGVSKKARLGAETETIEETPLDESEPEDLETDEWLQDVVSSQENEGNAVTLSNSPIFPSPIIGYVEEVVDLFEPIIVEEEPEILEPQTFDYVESDLVVLEADPVLQEEEGASSNVLMVVDDVNVATEFEDPYWQEPVASEDLQTENQVFESENNDFFDPIGEEEQIVDLDTQADEPQRTDDSAQYDVESTSASSVAARGRQARVPIVWESPEAPLPSTSAGARGARRQGRAFGKGVGKGQRGRAPPS